MNQLLDMEPEATAVYEMPAGSFLPVAPGVAQLTTIFVNLYVIDLPDGNWVLVDTGLPNFAWYVRQAVQSRYGNKKPRAILLTHGHFDHSGNAQELADDWHVPIYAHPLELPYLTGRSDYPPQDPTPGGAISFLSRFFPTHGIDLGTRVRSLPFDDVIPELPGWRWIHTPGHTAGHVSLLRDTDGTLIAGDAVVTTDLDAWSSQFTWPRKLSRPPTPLTPDWFAARNSIRLLADLLPTTIAAGHGLPIKGPRLGHVLRDFADSMQEPHGGRYSREPARYATDGSVMTVPPRVPDPLPRNLALGAAAAILGVVAMSALHHRRQKRNLMF